MMREMLERRGAVPYFVLRESCSRPWSLSAIGDGDGGLWGPLLGVKCSLSLNEAALRV